MDRPEPPPNTSHQYWDADDNHRVQRYYIALCLLMAAIQDALLGQVERDNKNLNWSATISYYSLVHAGRLLVFVAEGDFPTGHQTLQELLNGEQVRLNWLTKHRHLARADKAPNPQASFSSVASRLDGLGVRDPRPRLERFGKTLSSGCELRNDSNYEALLVAHEYEHTLISLAFNNLAAVLAAAAEEGLWLAIDAFNSLQRTAPPHLRSSLEGLVDSFLNLRVIPALENKVRGNEGAQLLRSVQEHLGSDSLGARDLRWENSLQMQLFGGKTRLMDRFRHNITELERTVGTYDPKHWAGWHEMPPGFPKWDE